MARDLRCSERMDLIARVARNLLGMVSTGEARLKHVTRCPEPIGVKTIEPIESRENHAAIELEREMGFTPTPYPGDATLMLVQRTLGTD